jgi:hypothetical protein
VAVDQNPGPWHDHYKNGMQPIEYLLAAVAGALIFSAAAGRGRQDRQADLPDGYPVLLELQPQVPFFLFAAGV